MLDNKCKDLQAKLSHARGHNVFLEIDVKLIYSSVELNIKHPFGLITIIIFDLSLVSTWRPCILMSLHRCQIQNFNAHGEPDL